MTRKAIDVIPTVNTLAPTNKKNDSQNKQDNNSIATLNSNNEKGIQPGNNSNNVTNDK